MDKSKKKTFYKHCIARECGNNSSSSPEKAFIRAPLNQDLRQRWLNAVGRKSYEFSSTNFGIYVCEDHFDLESDMENFSEWNLTKEKCVMKRSALPSLINKRIEEIQTSRENINEQLGLHEEIDVKIEVDTTDDENLSTCEVPWEGEIQESEVISPVKYQDSYPVQKSRVVRKAATNPKSIECPICSKITSNLPRHFERHHKHHKEVRILKKLEPKSEEVTAIRKRGFFRLKIDCYGHYPLRFLDTQVQHRKSRPLDVTEIHRLSPQRVSDLERTETAQNASSPKYEQEKCDVQSTVEDLLPLEWAKVGCEPAGKKFSSSESEQGKCDVKVSTKRLPIESESAWRERVRWEPVVEEFKIPRKNSPRISWTEEEKSLVRQQFSKFIRQRKAPKKRECEEFLNTYPQLFQGRGWMQIKAFVYNCYRSLQPCVNFRRYKST